MTIIACLFGINPSGVGESDWAIFSLSFARRTPSPTDRAAVHPCHGPADNYLGLILAYQIVTLPMLVWMLRSFIEDLPTELDESVAIDGGTRWTTFRHVLFKRASKYTMECGFVDLRSGSVDL